MPIQLISKMRIHCPAHATYEAFVDPNHIKNFWFSGSSARWQSGSTVTLTFKEYGAQFDIQVVETIPDERIVFLWGEGSQSRTVTIDFTETDGSTVVSVCETGWQEGANLTDQLVGNKEGWTFMLTCLKAYLENGITTLRTGVIL